MEVEREMEESPFVGSIVAKRKLGGGSRGFFFKTCGGIAVVGVLIAVAMVNHWHGGADDAENFYQKYFVTIGCNSTIAKHLKALTKEPHVAGSAEDMSTADYVFSTFRKYGLSPHYRDYDVLLTHPLKRSLNLTSPDGSIRVLSLTEKPAAHDVLSSTAEAVPPFHAYSPSGTVTGEVVYVNYGREEDFKKLEELEVDVSGSIVIARYGEIYRGVVVSNAARAGAVAAILYSDPKDSAGGGHAGHYPFSKWLPPSGVQRGTVFDGIGDPLTPGWPSTADAERLTDSELASRFPRIPSLPISAADALFIIGSLTGPIAPSDWHGALDLPSYHLGKGQGKLHFSYVVSQKVTTVRNVFSVIKGSEEPDRYILLGNHRDAWTFGAADPNSGTAALLEVARRFQKLQRHGWRPRRSIMFCSWDAEEYGMIGSTEWVEENMNTLSVKAVAYLNVDTAVAGPGFFAASTPQLDRLLKEITKKVKDPDNPIQTLYDSWVSLNQDRSNMITRLGGGGSDFVAFLQHLGIPSVDIHFGKEYPVYHSLYDTYHWMEMFGDPFFLRHTTVSALWGLLAMSLADSQIIPFDYTPYADELGKFIEAVQQKLSAIKHHRHWSIIPLQSALQAFINSISDIRKEVEMLSLVNIKKSTHLSASVRMLNDRLLLVERAFLDSDGLKGREWFKHLVYGPLNSGGDISLSFPGIDAAISAVLVTNDSTRWSALQHEIWRVSRAINRAALVLYPEFT